MRIEIRPLTVIDVASMRTWHYDPPYDPYDIDADPSDVELMLAAAVSGEGWYGAEDVETGEIVGFFEFVILGDQVEVGLGLRPDLTGRGLGAGFIERGLDFARERWSPATFALDVYEWNERAIRAYERAGFVRGEVYRRRFPGGNEKEFLRMTRPA
jgi:ribosomal-protein-alanine N-acetyltransferase